MTGGSVGGEQAELWTAAVVPPAVVGHIGRVPRHGRYAHGRHDVILQDLSAVTYYGIQRLA